MEFQKFNLHPHVAAGVTAAGYVKPTPVQKQAIPHVMAGRDVMGLAQTGTGKTAAYSLPVLHRLMKGARRKVRALVIVPTRELAEQINDSIRNLGRQTRLRSVTVYGGVGMTPQIERLRSGVEIVVACPGRLIDYINRAMIDLSQVEVLVLDEADRMFDMGFLPDIRKIIGHVPVHRQTLMFSATMPDDIRRLAQEVLTSPVTVQVDFAAPANTVTHALYPVAQQMKTGLLLELLRHTDTESVLIFTRTKHRANRVGEQLEKAGFRAASLQGNLSQKRRQAAINGFRRGSFQILVATDIAARGIDVSSISHVINYDMPDTVDAYTHRIGRTGRAARTGDALTFMTSDDGQMVKNIERVLGEKVERRHLTGFEYKEKDTASHPGFPRRKRKPQHFHQRNNPGSFAARGSAVPGRDRQKRQAHGATRRHVSVSAVSACAAPGFGQGRMTIDRRRSSAV